MESVGAYPSTGPTLQFPSAVDSRLAFALRRQRSHLRIVSGAPALSRPFFLVFGRFSPSRQIAFGESRSRCVLQGVPKLGWPRFRAALRKLRGSTRSTLGITV